jgi:hypothetical protein
MGDAAVGTAGPSKCFCVLEEWFLKLDAGWAYNLQNITRSALVDAEELMIPQKRQIGWFQTDMVCMGREENSGLWPDLAFPIRVIARVGIHKVFLMGSCRASSKIFMAHTKE